MRGLAAPTPTPPRRPPDLPKGRGGASCTRAWAASEIGRARSRFPGYDPSIPISNIRRRFVMSIFGDIMSAIFGKSAKAETPAAGTQGPATPAGSPAAAPAAPAPSASGAPAASAAPAATVDVAAVLDALAKQNKQKLNWRKSIVDLMKLLDLDSQPDRAQGARRGAALYRRHQGLGEDEYLAAQAGDDQARSQWRQGARRSEGLAIPVSSLP